MDIDAWLEAATGDVKRRGLPEVEPLLQALARMTQVLRATDFGEAQTDGVSRVPAEPGNGDRTGGTSSHG